MKVKNPNYWRRDSEIEAIARKYERRARDSRLVQPARLELPLLDPELRRYLRLVAAHRLRRDKVRAAVAGIGR